VVDLFRSYLGDFPILTEFTIDITTGGSKGKGNLAGIKVEKRFFFDGINMHGTSFSIDQGIIGAFRIFSNSTIASFFVAEATLARAELTLDFFIWQCLVIASLDFG